MKQVSKAVIAPIIGVLVILVQFLFGVEIPESVVNDIVMAIVNVIAVGYVVVGIFTNYKKNAEEHESEE